MRDAEAGFVRFGEIRAVVGGIVELVFVLDVQRTTTLVKDIMTPMPLITGQVGIRDGLLFGNL